MHIIRDILDKQLVDRDGIRMGRVDGIIGRLTDGAPITIESLELSWVTLGKRLHPRIGRLLETAHRKWSVRRSAHYHIEWTKVLSHDVHQLQVDVCAEETPATDWERWLRHHVIQRIPGSRKEKEEK